MSQFTGLLTAEVEDRITRGDINITSTTTSRTLTEIFRAHVFTRFNAVLGVLLLAVIVADSPGDGLFGFVLLANSTIGVLQEWSAKRTLDSLALLHPQTSRVIRDGIEVSLPLQEIVKDDIVMVTAGDQIAVDGTVLESSRLEVDESNLTGESDATPKLIGDHVMSGTIVTAGHGILVATSVGAKAYANRLSAEARIFTRVASEIQSSITRVLTWVTWVLIAVTPLQLWSHFRTISEDGWQDHVVRITAGLVGLVPEGLVLLTTLAFLSAAVSLSRKNVLVQELPAVETLARVDVVCLDKTGTLTSGVIQCNDIELVSENSASILAADALAELANDPSANNTLRAIQAKYPDVPSWSRTAEVPFDSTRKWKALSFADHGSWYLGAPEMLWSHSDFVTSRVAELAANGQRVMLLCFSPHETETQQLPTDLQPIAIVTLREKIRGDAADTVAYFAEQGVRVIVISGDNPQTVASIAHSVGVSGPSTDARSIGPSLQDIASSLDHSSIFGRVTPEQKRQMVIALQQHGHVVAMTGDGVNDTLALKRADIGIAMDNGAPATKAVAQIVLLDGKFSHLPHVLSEGRRVIGNVERVANLFMAKNAMSLLAILASVVAGMTFPILPRQMTLLSSVTIGVPAFFLALGSNSSRYQPGFLRRIMLFAWPAGAIAGVCAVISDVWSSDNTGTAATLTALLSFFIILMVASRPLRGWKRGVIASMCIVAVGAFAITPLQEFFDFSLSAEILWKSAVMSIPLLTYVVARVRKDTQKVL